MIELSVVVSSRMHGNDNCNLGRMLDTLEATCHDPSKIEVLVCYDTDDPIAKTYGVEILNNRPFTTRYAMVPRGRGYIDNHTKYGCLFHFLDPTSKAVIGVADDYVFILQNWDQSILELASVYEDNVFIIHGRPHPPDYRPDLYTKKFNVDCISMDDPGSLTGIDEAPIWGKKFLELCGYKFPFSFIDAWVISIEHKLWHKYKINRSLFLPSFLINREGNLAIDGHGTQHFSVRDYNFAWMVSKEYHDLADMQVDNIKKYLDNI